MTERIDHYQAAIHDAAGIVTGQLTTELSPAGAFAVTGQIDGDVRYLCYTDTLGAAETVRTLLQAVPVLLDEVDRLRAAVQRVRDLHVRTTDYDPDLDRGGPGVTLAWCQHCASDHWPCETVRALDGES